MNCPYCGTPLKETNYGNLFCPNHGIVSEKIEDEEEEKETNYIG